MLVSIIIPTYNRREMLKEAIDSVLAQDYAEKEIIIVDDGSTDGTRDLTKEYQGRIKYIYTENSGVSAARNIGIKEAKGELIAFLDSDDLWMPAKLSYQVEYFNDNPDIHICQTEEIWIRNGKRVNPKKIHKKYSGWIFEKCIPLCIVSPSAVMIRKKLFDNIGLFDEDMPACEDYDLWLRIASRYQIITLPKPMITKRGGHEDQLSKQWGLDKWRIYALEKVLKSGLKDERLIDLVKADIKRRREIYENGARKRDDLKVNASSCHDS